MKVASSVQLRLLVGFQSCFFLVAVDFRRYKQDNLRLHDHASIDSGLGCQQAGQVFQEYDVIQTAFVSDQTRHPPRHDWSSCNSETGDVS